MEVLFGLFDALADGHLDDPFQFGDVEWFLEEVVGVGFAGELGDVAIGAEEDDGDVLCAGVQFQEAGGFDAAGPGYPVIHDDDVGLIAADLADHLVAVVERLNVKSFFLQHNGADLQDIDVVVQYENPFIHN